MIGAVNLNAAIDKAYVIDGFEAGGAFRVQEERTLPGGKGLNVAHALRCLGEKVRATGFLAGWNGRFIEEAVRARGVEADFVYVPGESRVCIAVADRKRGRVTEIREGGPQISSEAFAQMEARVGELARACRFIAFSGSLPPGTPADAYARLLRIAQEAGAWTLLDASGQALHQGLAGGPQAVKPNLGELAEWWRLAEPEKAEAADLAALDEDSLSEESFGPVLEAATRLGEWGGVETVLVTLGGGGALAVEAGADGRWRAWWARGLQAPVVNTVGCGDAFVAGCLAGKRRGMNLEGCLRLAVASGASAATRLGVGEVVAEDVEAWAPQVRLQELSGRS